MSPSSNSPLANIEEGFQQLQAKYRPRAHDLRERLNQGKAITAEEEQWLDGPANLSDEQLK